MKLFKSASFLFLSLFSTSGCMSMNDQVNPDMKTWTSYYMSAEPFIFDFKFPVHKSEEMAKKDFDLSGMSVLEMDWLKKKTPQKLVISGYFERDGDGLPGFEINIILTKYRTNNKDDSLFNMITRGITSHEGIQSTYPNTVNETVDINNEKWIHFTFKEKDNSIGGESFCIPLDNKIYLSVSAQYFPLRKPGSKWLVERQEILRKVVDNFKIERKSEEKKKEEQTPGIDKK